MGCENCRTNRTDLDDSSLLREVDKGDMFSFSLNMPEDIEKALSDCQARSFSSFSPDNILVCGMGGSAIGGDLANSLLWEEISVPIHVNRDYHLPAFVSKNSLVFLVSYSGNTEETLNAYKEAQEKEARRIVICSGGKLKEIAREDVVIEIPSGRPPRSALPFLFVPIVYALESMGVARKRSRDWKETISLLRQLRENYSPLTPSPDNKAKQLAYCLQGKLPLLYSTSPLTHSVAYRWKTQFNENAKIHAYVDYFPELHHNEIMGWEGKDEVSYAVVLLRDKGENERIRRRVEITKELLEGKADLYEVWTQGESRLARIFSLLFLGDLVSLYLAILNRVDPQEINFINYIKSKLNAVGEG